MMRVALYLLLFGLASAATAAGDPAARVVYIANMGAMVEHGDTRVLFDPLFRNNFDDPRRNVKPHRVLPLRTRFELQRQTAKQIDRVL